jgi:hypothetical protein
VEVHGHEWWKGRFLASGFVHFPDLTKVIRKIPLDEKDFLKEAMNASSIFDPRVGGVGQYIFISMEVYVNPAIASLPEHEHLFAGDGCYKGPHYDNIDGGIPCTGEDSLPERYNSLLRCVKDEVKMKALGKTIADMYWTCMPRAAIASATAAAALG